MESKKLFHEEEIKTTNLKMVKDYLIEELNNTLSKNDNQESLIKNIETTFSEIHKQAERIYNFNEDQVVGFHNIAFLSGWESPLENIKNEINNIPDNPSREKWIKDFINKLKESFISVEAIEKQSEQLCSLSDILILDTQNSMPLLIKLYHYHKEDQAVIENISKLVELILFKLIYNVSDYKINNLNKIAKTYSGNSVKLEENLKIIVDSGFQDTKDLNSDCKKYFNGNFNFNEYVKYILWKYENHLRKENRTGLISALDFKNKFNTKKLENTIDHITPIDPNFTKYTDEFKDNNVNNIGNLTLKIWDDNSEKKNNRPIDKIDLFDSDFYSHKEIRDTLNNRKAWGEQEIIERKGKILKFVFDNWGIR